MKLVISDKIAHFYLLSYSTRTWNSASRNWCQYNIKRTNNNLKPNPKTNRKLVKPEIATSD